MLTEIECPTALAFLERYPTLVDARYLDEQRLAAFLRRHGYSGGRKPRELLERLRGAAHGRAGDLEIQARRQIVLGLVAALKPLGEQIMQLGVEIRRAVLEHPDGPFRSLFIDDRTVLCPATILADMGDSRDRYPTYRQLAADAGHAPVAVESGKSKRARFRWACDHGLREAIDTLADSSTTARGPRTSTNAREHAGAPARTRPGFSAAPGARSSGASGTTTTPTTPRDAPRCSES